jgi:hypothetical protein
LHPALAAAPLENPHCPYSGQKLVVSIEKPDHTRVVLNGEGFPVSERSGTIEDVGGVIAL